MTRILRPDGRGFDITVGFANWLRDLAVDPGAPADVLLRDLEALSETRWTTPLDIHQAANLPALLTFLRGASQ